MKSEVSERHRPSKPSASSKEDAKTMAAFEQVAKRIITTCTKDSVDTKVFLYTYRKYKPPQVLFELWASLAQSMIEKNDEALTNISTFLNQWMAEFWNYGDFRTSDQEMVQKLIPQLPGANGFKFLLLRLASEKKVPRNCKVYSSAEERTEKMKHLRSKSFSPVRPVEGSRMFNSSSNNLRSIASDPSQAGSSRNLNAPTVVDGSPTAGLTPVSSANTIASTFSEFKIVGRSRSNTRQEILPAAERPSKAAGLADFGTFSHLELASAITYQFSRKFMVLSPIHVCRHVGWTLGKKETCEEITDMIGTFNKTSRWVITEILSQTERDFQIIVACKMISIAKHCSNLQNFDGCLAILCGLSHYSVQNLKELWTQLPEDALKVYKELESVMSPMKNFRGYSELIAKGLDGPSVPYLGIIMRDVTFLMENKLYTPDGQLNFDLMTQVYRKLSVIKQCQTTVYDLIVPPVLMDFLDSVRVMSDDDGLHEVFLERSNYKSRKKTFSFSKSVKKMFT